MRIQFSDIKDKNKGTIGLVCGLGPSLKNDLKLVEGLSGNKEKYTTLSCNRYYKLTKIKADYWVIANSQKIMQIPQIIGDANKLNDTILLYADSVDETNKKTVDEKLTNKFIGFDQRHFKGKHCGWGKGKDGRHTCCGSIEAGRLTIQEELVKYVNGGKNYTAGGSVILHVLATAIMVGCNPIYITGVDFNYEGDGYVTKDLTHSQGKTMGLTNGPAVKQKVKEDLQIINNLAKEHGVNIYTPTKNGYLDTIFEYKELKDNDK